MASVKMKPELLFRDVQEVIRMWLMSLVEPLERFVRGLSEESVVEFFQDEFFSETILLVMRELLCQLLEGKTVELFGYVFQKPVRQRESLQNESQFDESVKDGRRQVRKFRRSKQRVMYVSDQYDDNGELLTDLKEEKEEGENVSPRKRRGRPPKRKPTDDLEALEIPELKMKLPRGRPSKKKLNNLDGSGNPEIKMKRPRGRPSKNTLKDVEENSENDQGSGCRNERKKLKSTLGRLQCEICGKGFGTKQRLKYHSVIHTGEKPYECPVCFKKFAFLSAMLGHRKSVHTNEKPHECKTCGARFIRRQQLLRHQVSHNPDKAPTCTICGTKFTDPQSIKKHMRIHTGETPFSCDLCDRAFNTTSSYQRHMAMHRGEKRHQCDICGHRFIQKGDMKRHRERHETDKSEGGAG